MSHAGEIPRYNPSTGLSELPHSTDPLDQLEYVSYVLKNYDRMMKAYTELRRGQICEELARMHGYDAGEVLNLVLTHRP